MSEVDKLKENKTSQTSVSTLVQTISLDGIHKSLNQVQTYTLSKPVKDSEAQGIIINFYSTNYSTKLDKLVQTDFSAIKLEENAEQSTKPELKEGRELKQILQNNNNNNNLACESRELQSIDYSPTTFKSSPTYIIHEPKQKVFMNTRKFPDSKATNRAVIDLERKKLEAELKATEEIARIQQTLIEKRLAVELASLQDRFDNPHKSISVQRSLPLSDSRIIEDKNVKKLNAGELKLAQEPEIDEKPARSAPPRPPPPTRLTAQDGSKIYNKKAESGFMSQTSSDFTPFRNLIDKKINLERINSKASATKPTAQASTSNVIYQDRRFFAVDARMNRINKSAAKYQDVRVSEKPGSSRADKARGLWKSAVSKIKKMKPPPKPSPYK